jgi:hypothetical protein
MNTVVARRAAQSQAIARHWQQTVFFFLILFASAQGWCQEDASATFEQAEAIANVSTAGAEEQRQPRVELSTRAMSRFESTDGATPTSRVDMTLLPSRRSALGFALGMSSPSIASAPSAFTGTSTSYDLGLHWRYTTSGNYRVDVSAWRRLVPADALSLVQRREPSYGARVEMRIGPAPIRPGFVADRGFVGFQMESGARITLRRSGGTPMVYYRTKF